jgi:magnesium chelatase family protein
MGPTEVREFCQTDASGEKLLKAAVQQLHLSARAYHCMLKYANHIAGAIQHRPRVGM